MGLLHDLGQVAGGALNALPGYSTLGANITNPAVNYKGIANPGTSQPTKATSGTVTPSTSSNPVTDASSGASSGPSVSDLAAYNLYAGQTNNALAQNDSALSAENTGVNNSYNQQDNTLASQLAAATNTYGQTKTQDQQDKLTNDNAINTQSNAGYQSLLRILGGMGAGGGSEAQYLVPQAVGQQASAQLSGAAQTYAKNEQSNDNTYNNYLDQEKGQQQQLDDWKSSQLANDQAAYNTTKSNLLSILSGINSRSAAPSDLATSLNSVVGTIPNIANINPTYTGSTPVYNAPSLSSYEAPTATTASAAANTPGSSSLTPYLALLTGQQQKQQQPTA